MNFWDLDVNFLQNSAIIDTDGATHSYADLAILVAKQELALAAISPRTFGFILCENSVFDLALYLACLRQGHVPLLLGAQMPQEQLAKLQVRYMPHWIAKNGLLQAQAETLEVELHPELALLLSTSGSTGSPRLVRLSRTALQANAASISNYLGLSSQERAITSLPMNYSYGLSVINSHFLVGATLVLNTDSVFSREFLQRIHNHQVTSLAGVPYTYQMLHRTSFFKQELPALRTLTQAGGRLDEKLIRLVAEHAKASNRRFFLMYGQTEACARISYVPPERLIDKVGSVGIAIPGGMLKVDAASGEMIYEGPNVMLGYAEQRADLARGDDYMGRLPTGDLGTMDEEGYFYITGRLKRFVKISGNRIGLDEVEQALQNTLQVPLAVAGEDDRLVVWLETQDVALLDQARELMRQQYAIHPTMTQLQLVDQLTLLPTGKKDYSALIFK
jgi:long-chain acyl-CoA synthetase